MRINLAAVFVGMIPPHPECPRWFHIGAYINKAILPWEKFDLVDRHRLMRLFSITTYEGVDKL